MSDGYKFTHYIIKIKIICRVRILWLIRTQVRINQRIRTHSFWVRILPGTNLPGTKSPETLLSLYTHGHKTLQAHSSWVKDVSYWFQGQKVKGRGHNA